MVHLFFHLLPTSVKKCFPFTPSALFLLFWNSSVTAIGVKNKTTPPTQPNQLGNTTGQTICDTFVPVRRKTHVQMALQIQQTWGLHRALGGYPGDSGKQDQEGDLRLHCFVRENPGLSPQRALLLEMQPPGSCRR